MNADEDTGGLPVISNWRPKSLLPSLLAGTALSLGFAASAFAPSAFGAALSEAPVTSGALKIEGIQSDDLNDDLGEGTAGIVAGADGAAGDAAIKVAAGGSPDASRALASASANV